MHAESVQLNSSAWPQHAERKGDIYGEAPPDLGRLRQGYHVRVCVPCYKEDLLILQRTCACALAALLPAGCSRTVYLLDDGKDPDKRKWCAPGPPLCRTS